MDLVIALFWALLVLAIVAAIPVSILYFTVTMTESKPSGARAFLEFVIFATVLSILLPVYLSVPGACVTALVFHKRRANRALSDATKEGESASSGPSLSTDGSSPSQ